MGIYICRVSMEGGLTPGPSRKASDWQLFIKKNESFYLQLESRYPCLRTSLKCKFWKILTWWFSIS